MARLTTFAVVATGTIRELLDASSADRLEAPALLDIDGVVTSYSELVRNVDAISSTVAAAGVAPDRAVAVVLANGPLMATAFLGVSSAAVCAPLNPAYTEAELSFFYDDLDIAALVTDGCSAHGGRTRGAARRPDPPRAVRRGTTIDVSLEGRRRARAPHVGHHCPSEAGSAHPLEPLYIRGEDQ